MILLGTLICFNFVIKDTGIYKIKSFAVVKKKYSHCRTVAICSFKPLVHHTNKCQHGGRNRYDAKLVRVNHILQCEFDVVADYKVLSNFREG